MIFKTHRPLTVIYRGNLEDTATLVGLVNARASVGLIAFTGELTTDLKKYFEIVNRWLAIHNLPRISIHPTMQARDLERLLACPLNDWGWGELECATVIRLANLPMPPDFVAA